ncbi:hypothetical protein L7F22_042599 [Adiantum nelumboides]|nr:hypothetical protein [Adiantum nelumboides]
MKLCVNYQTSLPRQAFNMEPPPSLDMHLRLLCKQGHLMEVMEALFLADIRDIHPDTCLLLLETCIKLKALAHAHQVHWYMMSNGLRPSLFLTTRLIDMYAKIGSIDKAHDVFNQMLSRDVVVWNALIAGYAKHGAPESALELLPCMGQDGILPDEATFVALLVACGRLGNSEQAKYMHGQMILCGVQQDLGISNTLIDMYAKCESMIDAYGVFEAIPIRNVVSWTAIISCHTKQGYGKEALRLFYEMKKSAINPDEVTFLIIINACATVGSLDQGKQIHFLLSESSITQTMLVKNALIDMYSKCGSMEHAFQVFNDLANRDLISWTTMIAGYARQGNLEKVLDLYDKMCQAGVNPSEVTFLSILNACANVEALDEGKAVHNILCMIGLSPSVVLKCTLVDMYAKSGCIHSARGVFNQMERRDSIAWNAMIAGYSQHGQSGEVFMLFQQMKVEGVEPDEGTFVNMLNVCASLTALDTGRQLHVKVERTACRSDLFISSALVDMYCKCGDMAGARKVFDHTLPNQCVVIWTAMITGYAQHGLYVKVLQFMRQMHIKGVQSNDLSFQKLLSACSYTGLVEEACFLFAYMHQVYGIKPHIEHYTCLVDLLGRAGRLEEAGCVIKEMTCRETLEVWMALLGACRFIGHVELAESAANTILKFMPYNASAFLLLRDIYAAAEMWTFQENG